MTVVSSLPVKTVGIQHPEPSSLKMERKTGHLHEGPDQASVAPGNDINSKK
jgi:hypothetical protein